MLMSRREFFFSSFALEVDIDANHPILCKLQILSHEFDFFA